MRRIWESSELIIVLSIISELIILDADVVEVSYVLSRLIGSTMWLITDTQEARSCPKLGW